MSDIESRWGAVRPSRFVDFLNRPLSNLWCVIGWLVASSLFGLLTRLAGGVSTSDAFVTVNSSLAIAHGNLSCAYPPQNTVGDNPLAPPLYPLISGGLSALFRIGHALPFPSAANLGPHCSHAFAAIGNWIVPTGALFTVVIIGYVGWIFLAVGVVALLRASGLGRCGWEPITLAVVACAPPVIMCLNEYFHPQDLIALGLSLGALASVFRQRWLIAGVLLGLAFTSQQFSLLIAIPIFFTAPRAGLTRLAFGFVAAIAIIDVPLIFTTSARSLKAIFLGTGVNTKSATWLVQLHWSGNVLYALSRSLPLVTAIALALWTRRRGSLSTEPVALLSLVAATLALRLVFEINLWGYYFMAVAVVLIVRQAIQSQINWWFVAWLALLTYAAIDGGLANRPALAPLPVSLWQLILVPWAMALSWGPLREFARRRSDSDEKMTKPNRIAE
jgi:hypothetical protein